MVSSLRKLIVFALCDCTRRIPTTVAFHFSNFQYVRTYCNTASRPSRNSPLTSFQNRFNVSSVYFCFMLLAFVPCIKINNYSSQLYESYKSRIRSCLLTHLRYHDVWNFVAHSAHLLFILTALINPFEFLCVLLAYLRILDTYDIKFIIRRV